VRQLPCLVVRRKLTFTGPSGRRSEKRGITGRQSGGEIILFTWFQDIESLVLALPTAAELYVPSLPGIPNLASHPTQARPMNGFEEPLTSLYSRHPLTLYAGELPSYPGEGQGGGDGDTGKDAQILSASRFRIQLRAAHDGPVADV